MLYIFTELGYKKGCSHSAKAPSCERAKRCFAIPFSCGEYYPLDNEFFYRKGIKNGQVKYTAQCKACHVQNYGA